MVTGRRRHEYDDEMQHGMHERGSLHCAGVEPDMCIEGMHVAFSKFHVCCEELICFILFYFILFFVLFCFIWI